MARERRPAQSEHGGNRQQNVFSNNSLICPLPGQMDLLPAMKAITGMWDKGKEGVRAVI